MGFLSVQTRKEHALHSIRQTHVYIQYNLIFFMILFVKFVQVKHISFDNKINWVWSVVEKLCLELAKVLLEPN